jgi:GxxExxY protein
LVEGLSAYASLPGETERIATEIVDAAFQVHNVLGPGLIESVYETCMAHELTKRGVPFQTQVALPIIYDGVRLESALRLDLLVADSVIVELKSVEQMHPVFEAQLLSYLRLSNLRLGFLINFNVPLIKQGIQRIIV